MLVEETRIGCFQIILLFLLGVNYVIVSMSHAFPAFQNYTPQFYCESSDGLNKTDGCIANSTTSVPRQQESFTFCTSEYIFITDYGERSIVTDWGLICERSYLKNFSTIVYYVGVSIGAWIAGIFSDRIGRLPVLAICLYTQGTMAVATYIVQSYPVFLVLRGLQGLFAQGLSSSTYILTLELFPAKFRTLVSSIMGVAWAAGLVLLAGLSYIIPDWRILQLAASVPTALTVLYVWIIPDSPRWLLAKGKTTEADIALEKIEKYNACCCGSKSRRELVPDSSENVTPVKPDRKSRVFTNEKDSSEGEAANLLTPSTSTNRNSRKISLRAITENLEKRLSNPPPETFIQVTEINTENIEDASDVKSHRISQTSQAKAIEDKPEEPEIIVEKDIPAKNDSSEEEMKDKPEEEISDVKNRRCQWIYKHSLLLKYGGIMACQWFSVSVMSSLVIHFLPSLVNNRHINFAIGGTMELTIYVVIFFILSRHGRRFPIGICQTLNGVICITIAGLVFQPRVTVFSSGLTKLVLLYLARVTALVTSSMLHLYTVEIFPTVIRGTCVGMCIFLGTIGTISAPYILLLESYVSMVSFNFAGLLCLLSAILCFILPETQMSLLPENIEDVKYFKDRAISIDDETIEDAAVEREILREKLFSEDWVDAGNGIIVNFSETKN